MTVGRRTYYAKDDKLILVHSADDKSPQEWTILELIGEGGSSVCYEALHAGKKGRLKQLSPLSGEITGQSIEKFLSVYRALDEAKCRDARYTVFNNYIPHYEILYTVGEDGQYDGAYIWTPDDKNGMNFEDYILEVQKTATRDSALKVHNLLSVLYTISDCICLMHMAGLLHLDIKPSNFLIARDSRGSLNTGNISMFDINTMVSVEEENDFIAGTQGFAAPEIEYGEADNRSDLYSLGAVLYYAISNAGSADGHYDDGDFEGLEAYVEASDLLKAGSDEKTKSLLLYILRMTLAVNPEDRYECCEDLLADLERCRDLQHRHMMEMAEQDNGSANQGETTTDRNPFVTEGTDGKTTPFPKPDRGRIGQGNGQKSAGRKKLLLGLAAALVLVIAGVFAWLRFGADSGDGQWGFYTADGQLITDRITFTRQTGDSVTLVPGNQRADYSLIVFADMGYGSYGDDEYRFVTVADKKEKDVTDSVKFTNEKELGLDPLTASNADQAVLKLSDEMENLRGSVTITLTDWAHYGCRIFVLYESEEGKQVQSFKWMETEGSLNLYTVRNYNSTGDLSKIGYNGFLINAAEYACQGIDWRNGESIAFETGNTMQEVVDRFVTGIREGKYENTGYLWIQDYFSYNDPVSETNVHADQTLSLDYEDVAFEGAILRADVAEYDTYLSFSYDFRQRLKKLGDSCNWHVDGVAMNFQYIDYDTREDVGVSCPVIMAVNVKNESDIVYLISATDLVTAYYPLMGTPDTGFNLVKEEILTPEVHEGSGTDAATIKIGNSYYYIGEYLNRQSYFPKLDLTISKRMNIIGPLAEASDGGANITLTLAEGASCLINGESYLCEDGVVKGTASSGGFFTLNPGETREGEGYYEMSGTTSCPYTVLVKQMEE